MNSSRLDEIRKAWGASYFEPSPVQLLADLPLVPDAASLLRGIGLPTGPPAALALCLRFENVNIIHRPAALHLLTATDLEIGPAFPRTGHPELDTWIDLRNFVVLGEVPNDSEPGPWFRTRLLCVDGTKGNVWWVYQALSKHQCTDCEFLNSSLAGYLGSLLAYKQFRDESSALLSRYPGPDEETPIEDPPYVAQCEVIHKQFLERLQAADPSGFKDAFWENHAWNESILMHS